MMPTVYTEVLHNKGQSFEAFVWRCARAFGALVLMREDRLDAPVPKSFRPDEWHKKALSKAESELLRWWAMSLKDAGKDEAAFYARRVDEIAKANAGTRVILARYEAMRKQVAAWSPPTPEHAGLRDFMLQQLAEGSRYMAEIELPKRVAPAEWKRVHIEKARRDVEYHSDGWTEEQERTSGRNQWLDDLLRSVPLPSESK